MDGTNPQATATRTTIVAILLAPHRGCLLVLPNGDGPADCGGHNCMRSPSFGSLAGLEGSMALRTRLATGMPFR